MLHLALPPLLVLGTWLAGDPADTRIQRGREALAAGRPAEAIEHFQRALVLRPASSEVLALAFEAAAGDADARALWAEALCASALDARGKLELERSVQAAVKAGVPVALDLAAARAAAVVELDGLARGRAKQARSRPAEALIAWWANGLGHELARPAPGLAAERPLTVVLPDKLALDVAKELKRVLSSALSAGRLGEAARAATILRGLGNQANSEDLQGDAPGAAKELEGVGAEGLARARERMRSQQGEPYTLEALEELDADEQLAFTRAHGSPANPGVGVSPAGLYRLETICGFETLLGLVESVDHHHRRLAAWYGEDPFADRPGLVRVLPEAAGLESEGTPFWWAGGFQSGDLTVLRFSIGNIAGLGRGLTHELTHRFDGALYPGTPSWLAEGRAVWTGGSYRFVESEEFVDNHISFGTVESAFIKGYGGARKLRELIEGTIEDYRDNYVAGYALYVYLKLWEQDGRLLFAEQLAPYMSGIAKGSKDPVEWFARNFADGRGGRPADFDAFAADFGEFVKGFYWETRAPWTDRYEPSIEGGSAPWVYDEPTWSWSRSRAEPFFGQDHARAAGALLLDLGKERQAADAYLFALSVDERSPARNALVAGLLEGLGQQGPAWTLRDEDARPLRAPGDRLGVPAPFARELARTHAFHALLLSSAETVRAGGAPAAAAVWTGEANVLAAWLGLPLAPIPAVPSLSEAAAPSEEVASRLHPLHEPPRRLDSGVEGEDGGWIEDGLTGYEERRVEGLWYGEDNGDLHVGRERPRTGTGQLDRRAHNRHAFTRTVAWQGPGRYRISARVQFTTSYVSGALVLGYTRRDRNIRVGFSAGDFMYAIGKKEEGETIDGVNFSVRGLRERDGALPGSTNGGRIDFDAPRAHFLLEVVVDGATLHVWIEGQHVATYHVPDGQPIEGALGFATSYGAIRVIEPVVQRLDATWDVPVDGPAWSRLDGLDLVDPEETPFDELTNRTVRGLARAPQGQLAIWIPIPELEDEGEAPDLEAILRDARKYGERAAKMLYRVDASQELVLVLPDLFTDQDLRALEAELAGEHDVPVRVVVHRTPPAVYDSSEALPGPARTWLLFIDSAGVLRFATRFYGSFRELPKGLDHWIAVFREHRGGR